jgi:hypothetical protein
MQTELRNGAKVNHLVTPKKPLESGSPAAPAPKAFPWRGIFSLLAFGAVIAFFLYMLMIARPYYTAMPVDRPHMEEHALLRPAGLVGHGFGIVGSLMLLSLLAYSARKRFRFMRNWGNVKTWLGVHIFFGVAGPLLITLHTAFKFNGMVAVSYWSMIAVMVSGFVGRYLYAQIPRDLRGMELTMQETRTTHQGLIDELCSRYSFTKKEIEKIENYLVGDLHETPGLARGLFLVLWNDMTRWWRMMKVRRFLRARARITHDELLEMIRLVRQQALLRREILFFQSLHRLFHYWHVIHKPFAYVMYTIMFMHIGVTVAFGYWWIFE